MRRAVYFGDFVYRESSGGSRVLHDLAADPREEKNLVGERQAVEARGAELLGEFLATVPEHTEARGPLPAQSDEDLRGLKALGYVE